LRPIADQQCAVPIEQAVADFPGTMNRIPCVITDDGRVSLLGSVVDIRTAVSGAGVSGGAAGGSHPPGTPVDVLVRPEGLAVNSAVAVPTGSAVEVTLTERSVMVAHRTASAGPVAAPLEVQAPDH